jgi:hypothetical protein
MASYAVAVRPGVMQRAGLSGTAVGFDWGAAIALAASEGIQTSVASYFLARIETGALAGMKERLNGSD